MARLVKGLDGDGTVQIDPKQWRRFMKDLRRLAPEVQKALRKELKELLVRDVIPDARSNASWSSRIPKAIRPRVVNKGVGLRVAARNAPHARPYEGISPGSDRRGFRHPVFGNREIWVQQRARPFLRPAVEENRDEFMRAAGEAIDRAARQTGWR